MKEIQDIINWNKICWNDTYNPNLEKAMLMEEVEETIKAIEEDDYIEILNWIIDIFFVWIWTLHKRWFTAEQIEDWLNRVIMNNFSKFEYDENWYHTCIRDSNWKIRKPEWFTPVDLSDIIPSQWKHT